MIFRDRKHAGELLAERLSRYKGNSVVLAIPRGGLEIGKIVAEKLECPLDVILSKKIGHPSNPEYAVGAVSLKNSVVFDYNISRDYIEKESERVRRDLEKKNKDYLKFRPNVNLEGKNVIIVDDGVATGSTVLTAIDLVKEKAGKVVVAVPVSSPEALDKIKDKSDEVVCLYSPRNFMAIGQFYENFPQLSDGQAVEILKEVNSDY